MVPARIARTGVQQYPDGPELRPASEVLDAGSLASFEGAPVTVGHAAFIDADNVEEYAVGYARNVTRDPNADARGQEYVQAELVIIDEATIASVLDGSLAEVSAGYSTEVDGTTEPPTQRDIVANHVALGPSGWARCGSGCAVG